MRTVSAVLVVGLLSASSAGAECDGCCGSTSPLVLDLEGNDILTTGMFNPVIFDIDGDDILEWSGWTRSGEADAFLWLDRNGNRKVDSGRELFGTATPLPEGGVACNGFEALAVHDRIEEGGNADGQITRADEVWPRLRLWIDLDHDAVSRRRESHPLGRFGVTSIDLAYSESDYVAGNMNQHRFIGSFTRRIERRGRVRFVDFEVHDIYFQTGLTTPPDRP